MQAPYNAKGGKLRSFSPLSYAAALENIDLMKMILDLKDEEGRIRAHLGPQNEVRASATLYHLSLDVNT